MCNCRLKMVNDLLSHSCLVFKISFAISLFMKRAAGVSQNRAMGHTGLIYSYLIAIRVLTNRLGNKA